MKQRKILKQSLLFILLMLLLGCTSVYVPNYIQDRYAYFKRYYADYPHTLEALQTALENLGWEIESQMDPKIYEHNRSSPANGQHLLIIAKRDQKKFFVKRAYSKMNIYIHSSENISEVEIRIYRVNVFVLKINKSYRSDERVQDLFIRMKEILEKQSSN